MPLLHHLYSEVTRLPHSGPAINRLMQAGACYYCLLSPEKLLPADVTIPEGWWMICCLHGHEELLAGREIIMGRTFPMMVAGKRE